MAVNELRFPQLKVADDGAWRDKAECRTLRDNTLFFGFEQGRGKNKWNRQVATAKEMCGRCPVRQECLDFAQSNNIGHGIWGGLTPQERSQ